MGMIESLFGILFGGGRNVVRDTVEVFRENAETGAARGAKVQGQAMNQYGDEFSAPVKGGFDRFMDGVNRLPRPALALGTLGMFVAAMVDPLWFAARMHGIALVPEPLWWLLGVIVSFYFGARHQFKGQAYRRSIAQVAVSAPEIARSIEGLEAVESARPDLDDPAAQTTSKPAAGEANPALNAWREQER
jgi:hypothetical protein